MLISFTEVPMIMSEATLAASENVPPHVAFPNSKLTLMQYSVVYIMTTMPSKHYTNLEMNSNNDDEVTRNVYQDFLITT